MSDHSKDNVPPPTRAEIQREVSWLDKMIEESRLYKKGRDYKELLDFAARLPNMAPFNAMLIQLQKPGVAYVASAREWRRRFNRRPKEGARPLLILVPFSPVGLVYDLQDTEGDPVPKDTFSFAARGNIDLGDLDLFKDKLQRKNIEVFEYDAGDQNAGYIRVVRRSDTEKEYSAFKMGINRNHNPPAQLGVDRIFRAAGHVESILGLDLRTEP